MGARLPLQTKLLGRSQAGLWSEGSFYTLGCNVARKEKVVNQ